VPWAGSGHVFARSDNPEAAIRGGDANQELSVRCREQYRTGDGLSGGAVFGTTLDYASNATSREFRVISACITGPSNVLKAFSGDEEKAVNSISSLEPPGVNVKLRASLP
jgi:hypothetical protein